MMLGLMLCSCKENETEASVPSAMPTDLVISEVLTSNSTCAKAYDGRYYDWVELYNPHDSEMSLDGYYLSDSMDELQKASLQGQTIPARGYLLIYCSGLNMTDEKGFLHTGFKLSAANGETVYLSNSDSLSYVTVPVSEPDISYGIGSDGVTYGWLDEPTPGKQNIGNPEAKSYPVRINEYMSSNTFTIYDCEGDCGDWVELCNTSGKDVDLSGWGLTDDDANAMKFTFPEGSVIKGNGCLLLYCDGKNKQDAAGVLHTGFSLSAEDGLLSLYSPGRQLVSSVTLFDLPANISCGWSDSDKAYRFFARPTPGKPNSTTAFEKLSAELTPDFGGGVIISESLSASGSTGTSRKYDFLELYNTASSDISLKGYTLSNHPGTPVYSFSDVVLEAGKYLLLICDGTTRKDSSGLHVPVKINAGGETFYLADKSGVICDVFSTGKGRRGISSGRAGSDTSRRYFFSSPTPGSANEGTRYQTFAPMPAFSVEGGVIKKGTSVSLSVPEGYTIVYTTDGSEPTRSSAVYRSAFKIRENTVIRAAAYGKSALISDCVTQTYLVDNPHTIPIFCVSGKPEDLTKSKGIFLDETNSQEKRIYAEYFDEQGKKEVEFPCGAALFGPSSRKHAQKGVKLTLRETYGVNEVTYPFFRDNEKAVRTFSKILLRPSGEEQLYSKLRDELVPALIRGRMDLDFQEFQACALYINGQYWGAYYIREHLGSDYVYRYYGYEKGDYDIVKAQHIAQEGTLAAYKRMTKFCEDNNLGERKNYEALCKIVDMDSLINYWIVETYFGNSDTVNLRCYKHKDGKWRWMLYDLDWSMQANKAMRSKDYIYMHLLDPKGHGIGHYNNALMRKLLTQNEEFRTRFLTAYCYHISNTFAPDRAVEILDGMAKNIEGEIKLNEKVWHFPKYKTWVNTTVPYLRSYLKERPAEIKRNLMTDFHLSQSDWEHYMTLAKDYKPENEPVK